MDYQSQSSQHMRTCIACGAREQRNKFIRIVRTPQKAIALDLKGTMPGRGAYVCNKECFEVARRKQKFSRALRTSVQSEELIAMQERL